ncbi:ABC transporter substrate-binding protein, partial [Methylobacterium sp. 37f]|nr:ABC transporter substrate-binding protein [Methylobacterium sp. 37f]
DKNLQGLLTFNAELSESRTAAVDTLFDQLITFQLEPLKAATKVLHEVDAALAKKDNAKARALAKEARDLIAAMPITDAQAASPEIKAAFTGGKEKSSRQAELEQQWSAFAKEKYAAAKAKADEALKLLR